MKGLIAIDLMTADIYKKLIKWIQDDDVIKFYSTKEWRKLRVKARERDHNECQRCKSFGKYSKADMVHHKKVVKFHPMLALRLDNVESECKTCHNIMHPEKFNNKPRFTNEEKW